MATGPSAGRIAARMTAKPDLTQDEPLVQRLPNVHSKNCPIAVSSGGTHPASLADTQKKDLQAVEQETALKVRQARHF